MKIKILGQDWEIRFLSRSLMYQQNNGTCYTLRKTIDIADDMELDATRHVITHELTHAVMNICGRVFEENIPVESVCETVAMHIDEIAKIRDLVMNKRKKDCGKDK